MKDIKIVIWNKEVGSHIEVYSNSHLRKVLEVLRSIDGLTVNKKARRIRHYNNELLRRIFAECGGSTYTMVKTYRNDALVASSMVASSMVTICNEEMSFIFVKKRLKRLRFRCGAFGTESLKQSYVEIGNKRKSLYELIAKYNILCYEGLMHYGDISISHINDSLLIDFVIGQMGYKR